ncbi:MAG: mechanosensitive ion channel family protein [Anaerococcus sp.]|uniref:mechanosensitive ion channel family protein n=1 Tax=Anaerococcus sp. TaxID=1872515 RepID=UPI00262A9262|nr:mechanosensitive ion channel family protein [Anaerococcus sp.]MCI5971600.1 mechanosensitive ion channel family protein [Anaerococcus sp.]MDD6918889.1 mechanosensitive ion channel family protein [Peptoniphilaceae bacterium]MDY2927528.1 mechanosensitive ion channel family protein [Anaerococcus sp.]
MIDQIEDTQVVRDLMKNKIIFTLVAIAIILIVSKLILNILKRLINKLLEGKAVQKSSLNQNKVNTISSAIYSVIRVVVIFIAITLILDVFGINTSTLIATAGVGGVALALGTQTIIEDFIKGILIIVDDKIRVGEWIKVAGIEGEVEDLDFRVTKVRDFNGSLHIIPNSQITSVQNFNRGEMIADTTFSVSYDTPLDEIKDMVGDISMKLANKEENKGLFIEKFKIFEINSLEAFSYKVRITATVKDGEQWQIGRQAREMIKYEMEKRKIKSALVEYEENEEI